MQMRELSTDGAKPGGIDYGHGIMGPVPVVAAIDLCNECKA